MILTVHNLAKTYMLLPSEVLSRATTFDLYVLDTYSRYVKYQEAKQQGKAVLSNKGKNLSVNDMKAMLARVRTPEIVEREAKEREKK